MFRKFTGEGSQDQHQRGGDGGGIVHRESPAGTGDPTGSSGL